jgi:hypothetical protein
MILTDEENFRKISKKEIEEIYGEVTINEIEFGNLVTHLRKKLNHYF